MWTTLAYTHAVAPHRFLQVVDGTYTLAGFLPVGANRVSLFSGLRPGERRESLRMEPWKARVREVCAAAPGAAPLLDQVRDFEQSRFAGYRAVHLRRLRHGPVVFLGDAAHSMTPHLGQGANLALLDAYILSRELLHQPAGVPLTEAADRYAALRRSRQQFYFLITTALSPLFQSGVPSLTTLRNLTLPWLPRVPWIGAEMAHTVTGFKSGFFGRSIAILAI
ncbi:MAG: FAD-dependent monooxygenase [Acidobacteria bacterium]|nr:FAD-dependent monooxygenase [Acidobacteriota bacterium]